MDVSALTHHRHLDIIAVNISIVLNPKSSLV